MKARVRCIACLLCLLCFVSGFIGCSRDDSASLTEFSGIRMTIPYRILVPSTANPAQIQSCIDNLFNEVDTIFNDWNPASEVSRLNNAHTTDWIALSPQLEQFLRTVEPLVTCSHGRFDPTVGKRSRLWKERLNLTQLPTPEELDHCPIGWNLVELRPGHLRWHNPNASLDLGAVAKGDAVDKLTERLSALGYKNTYVEWGGEIRVSGHHPSGRPWRIAVNTPSTTPQQFFDLSDAAIATSGDYAQSWTIDGVTYTHILDPRTGYPLQPHQGSISSVTVIAPTALLADALATAGMVFNSLDEAQAWASTIPNVKFFFQTN